MLDINFIREHPKKVKKGIESKGFNPELVDQVLELDEKRRELIQKTQKLRQERNEITDKIKKNHSKELIEEAKKVKAALQDLEPELRKTEAAYTEVLLQIPNIPSEEVPVGKDESDNVTVKTWGEKPEFDFEPKEHIELGLKLGLLDLDRGAKVAGYRGYFLKNEAVLMHFGIMRYAMDKLIAKGFIPTVPPIINRKEAFFNSGHFPWGEEEGYALMPEDPDQLDTMTQLGGQYHQANIPTRSDMYLAGTAEVPLVSYHANEVLAEKELPLLYAGFSPCYRREVGSYGRDTRGIYRVHEFMKIEQVIICKADDEEAEKWHENLAEYAQEMLQELNLHYRVLLMCTGDMGEGQVKKFDIETWMPGKKEYGETQSDSIMGDFQARRANIRYRGTDGELHFAYTLNNTALASPRILVALWENYQQEDGSILIPPVLRPYIGLDKITPKE